MHASARASAHIHTHIYMHICTHLQGTKTIDKTGKKWTDPSTKDGFKKIYMKDMAVLLHSRWKFSTSFGIYNVLLCVHSAHTLYLRNVVVALHANYKIGTWNLPTNLSNNQKYKSCICPNAQSDKTSGCAFFYDENKHLYWGSNEPHSST